MIKLKSFLLEINNKEVMLYHLTWKSNVDSILEHGLIPNHAPNKWAMAAANERSKLGSFLSLWEQKTPSL